MNEDIKLAALRRLEAWASQDPTGPVDAGGVSLWVRSQIKIAIGDQVATPLTFQPRSISKMEAELISLRNEVHAARTATQTDAAKQWEESPQRQLPDPRSGKLTSKDAVLLADAIRQSGSFDCIPGWMRDEINAKLPNPECVTIPRQLFEELTSAAIELEENLENICQHPNFGTLKQLSETVDAAVKIRDATATP